MYRRTNTLLAIVAFLATFLIVPAITYADQFGLGGAYVDGHSDNGKYGINNSGDQSWGIVAHYDKDMGWKKQLSKLHAVRVEPMLGLQYLHWTKNNNKERTRLEYDDIEWQCFDTYECERPRYAKKITEEYQVNEKVDTLIMSVGPKFIWDIGKFSTFASAGAGYALQDGARDDLAAVFSAGIQYRLTDKLGFSLTQWEDFVSPFGEYERFDKTVLAIEIFF
jgi:hypothetical protein